MIAYLNVSLGLGHKGQCVVRAGGPSHPHRVGASFDPPGRSPRRNGCLVLGAWCAWCLVLGAWCLVLGVLAQVQTCRRPVQKWCGRGVLSVSQPVGLWHSVSE